MRVILGLILLLFLSTPALAIITEEDFNFLRNHALILVDSLTLGSTYTITIEDIQMTAGQGILEYTQARHEAGEGHTYAIILNHIRAVIQGLTLVQVQQAIDFECTHMRILLHAAAQAAFHAAVQANSHENHTESFEGYARAAAYYMVRMIYRIMPGNDEVMDMAELEQQALAYMLQAFNQYMKRNSPQIHNVHPHQNFTDHEDHDDDRHPTGAILIPQEPPSLLEQALSLISAY